MQIKYFTIMWKIYNPSIPDFIKSLAEAPAMQRLKDVGMHCGCEYTSFPMFEELDNYSRYKQPETGIDGEGNEGID